MIRATTVLGALVALTASAAAQPAERTCEVRFVRAPDDVRHVIETWLAAEPRCTSKIDLRVIPTDQGFYLIAQRPDGRLHERYVPDSQSAGVLVASWVADDWVTQASVSSSPRPTGAPVELTPPPTETAPSVAAVSAAPSRNRNAPRWLSVGTAFSAMSPRNNGMRIELDVLSRGNFTFGAGLARTGTPQAVTYGAEDSLLWATDSAATLYAAYALRSARWELRTALGFGATYSEVAGYIEPGSGQPWSSDPRIEASGVGIMGTASMILTARMGDRWGIHAGLLGHRISESLPSNQNMELMREDGHLFVFTGVRVRI